MNSNSTRARAIIKGGDDAPGLLGEVRFFQEKCSVLVTASVSGLLENSETGFFAMHIHEGESCRGENFSKTGGHFNPNSNPHPMHAGDLPPLLSCKGKAYMQIKTDRFTVNDIIGKTVVIHSGADDFHTQPAGNSGEKTACGVICRI